jgi:phytoene synthase
MTNHSENSLDRAIAHCADLVARNDEDFRLSAPYAIGADQNRMLALFAFLIELRRIPNAVSEPPLGEIRLQWHRDALTRLLAGEQAAANPVFEALAASGFVTREALPYFERMIDARSRLLYEPAFADLKELKEFLRDAEAPVALIAAQTFAADRDEIERRSLAYALARFAPILAPGIADAAAAESKSLIARNSGGAIPSEMIGRLCFLSLAGGYAARPDGRRWPVAKRARLFAGVAAGHF